MAQRASPSARVVYAGNGPIMLTHARALLASDLAGAGHGLSRPELAQEPVGRGIGLAIEVLAEDLGER